MSDELSTQAKLGYTMAGFGAIIGVGFLVHLLTLGDSPRSNPAPRKYQPMSTGYWINDPDMRPAALAKRLTKAIRKKVGRDAKIEVLKAEASLPSGWDYSNIIMLNVNGIAVGLSLRVAVDQEASGYATIDGSTLPVPRDVDPKVVEAWLTSEIVGHIGGSR